MLTKSMTLYWEKASFAKLFIENGEYKAMPLGKDVTLTKEHLSKITEELDKLNGELSVGTDTENTANKKAMDQYRVVDHVVNKYGRDVDEFLQEDIEAANDVWKSKESLLDKDGIINVITNDYNGDVVRFAKSNNALGCRISKANIDSGFELYITVYDNGVKYTTEVIGGSDRTETWHVDGMPFNGTKK